MRVVDIGCGPGSITVGLAAAVAPGEAVGIDIEPTQVALGQGRAKSLGLENCRFETGSVYQLPLADRSVDAVFGHTILMQFRDLDPVLAEIKRVLKPGGLVGFREPDFGASLFHSETSALREVMSILGRSILHNDGNPDIGRRLPGILASAGFDILIAGATYACAATPRAKADMYAVMTRLWEQSQFVAQAEALGWIDAALRHAMPERLRREAVEPASFSASSFAEVVGRKVSS
jgi:SAM-dependent methyltransferase